MRAFRPNSGPSRARADSISARFGLSHGIVNEAQYSLLIAAVIGSAAVPTLIANAFYLPRHLLSRTPASQSADQAPPAPSEAKS
jgi:glutathione-regulated potassium-efflux system ancillary protein KefC